MPKSIRTNLLRTLKKTGVFDRVLDSSWRRRQLLILCYHSVALEQENQWRPAQFLTLDRLRERFEFLKRGGYRVLDLEEGMRGLRDHTLPARSVVLTFDDGTFDFYKLIYPLLAEYQFPATVYQTTHYCPRRIPVFSFICGYMLWKKRDLALEPAPELGIAQRSSLADAAAREEVVQQMTRFAEARQFSSQQKNELAAGLAERLGLDYQDLARRRIAHLMTPEEIAELAARGIKFELHTHRHRTPRDRNLFLREIDDNRNALEEMAGKRATHFCYPSGDYDLMFLPWLAERGVSSATTCVPGLAALGTQPLLLPRFIDTTGQTELDFESWVTGVRGLLAAGAQANPLKRLFRSPAHR
jgi:peptidoglycan/xylan/chitin deacetylase (PgdA/CDA1 family)